MRRNSQRHITNYQLDHLADNTVSITIGNYIPYNGRSETVGDIETIWQLPKT